MELTINNETIQIDDIFSDEIKRIIAKYSTQNALIKKINLYDVKGDFLIKNYQRGYRWTKTEIEELLNDIAELEDNEGYCLQPLVVTNIKDANYVKQLLVNEEKQGTLSEVYELIDGQQRLTTIRLIKEYLSVDQGYNIYYELLRDVDNYFISKAYQTIEDWFKKNDKQTFCNKLKNLFFVWYEVTQGSSEEIFKSVNDGKVPLTNAELFKALLLDESNSDNKEDLVKLSYEWDKIESFLRDDDFWAFISNDTTDSKTRIDYLLDIYAKKIKDNAEKQKGKKESYKDLDFNKERFSFLVVQRYLKENSNNVCAKNIWEEIVKVYEKLYSWYKDEELYHTIGFLITSEEKQKGSKATASVLMCELYNKYQDKTFSEIRNEIKYKIYDKYFSYSNPEKKKTKKPLTFDDVKYYYEDKTIVDNKWLKAILLFSNIYAGYFFTEEKDSVQRFPFRTYKSMKWDIEHIRPKELKQLDKSKSIGEIRSAGEALKIEGSLSDNDSNEIDAWLIDVENNKQYIIDKWNQHKVVVDHDLSNLVLLDSNTNREYGNAFFCRKRNDIIKFDVEGRFIPLCTKRAFLKYFSEGEDYKNSPCWTIDSNISGTSDKTGYKKFLDDMFDEIQKWGKR